ncbi:DUF1302 domain-containing protein [Azospirillum halopraeferens]|uniref:DUF1302 domain-containing protein n=1 Tax=Azospirillum halopraeferens TaxID=34010 RepID=UPI000400F12D|nr:DUF1302 domain-containing protein [Azospirillum halopraeferens]
MTFANAPFGRLRRPFPIRAALLAGAALLGPALAQPAAALDFKVGDATVHFDTTLQAGVQVRVQDRDCRLIGRANGGCGTSINGDDGNLNYDPGIVSSLVRATHELSIKQDRFGAFVRGTYFYDYTNAETDREFRPLSTDARKYVARGGELLDAYVFGGFDAGGHPVDVRVGNQVLSWGESTYIPNGINIINPVNVAALRTPGSELRQAFLPLPIIDVRVGLTDTFSIEGFYQGAWRRNRLEPPGTYFSTNDFIGPGSDRSGAYIGYGHPLVPDNRISTRTPVTPFGSYVPMAPDDTPRDHGQFGVAARYFAEELNSTELGLYFINYHSRSPVVSGRTGALASAVQSARLAATGNFTTNIVDYAETARVRLIFPENIKLYGASFNTLIGGMSLQGEVSYRRDQPIQIDDIELLQAALAPAVAATQGGCLTAPDSATCRGTLAALNTNQILRDNPLTPRNLVSRFDSDVEGYRLHDVVQAQMSATRVFGSLFGADQWVLVGEAGFTYIRNMPDSSTLRYDGPGTTASGNPLFPGTTPATTQYGGYATPFSWGYRAVARFDYNNVWGGVNLSPSISFAHDVNGTTPNPLGTFVEGRKAVTLALAATYLERYQAELAYTTYFGAGEHNLLRDRDFVSLVAKYSF